MPTAQKGNHITKYPAFPKMYQHLSRYALTLQVLTSSARTMKHKIHTTHTLHNTFTASLQ